MSVNLAQCKTLVAKAVAAHAKALFLPEASDYIGASAADTVSLARPVLESVFVLGLQEEARREKLAINVGIHEPAMECNKVRNTSIWIDEEGNIVQRYQKLHLFDVDIKNGPALKESNSVEKGTSILPPFETPVGRVGLTICFDVRYRHPQANTSSLPQLRFPEISLALARQDSQLIAFPSAFTVLTGKVHWEPLLRARAIETQAYVVAAAQVGAHNERRLSYGHSMIVSPWGEVVAKLGGEWKEPEIATADIDLELVEAIKREMPLLRRVDIYPEV